jgi:hypothetical protein
VAELAGKGAVFGTALAVGVQSVVFDCALAHSFISSSRGGVGHSILPGPGVKVLIVASARAGWPSNRASVSVWLGERVNLRCQRHGRWRSLFASQVRCKKAGSASCILCFPNPALTFGSS